MSMIAVWGPPRSGKTTLTIDLAYALSQQGKSVCLISPEPYSEMTVRMGIRIVREKSLEQAYENIGNLRQTVLEADDLLFVLAMPWNHDAYGEEAGTDAVPSRRSRTNTPFLLPLKRRPTPFLPAPAQAAASVPTAKPPFPTAAARPSRSNRTPGIRSMQSRLTERARAASAATHSKM